MICEQLRFITLLLLFNFGAQASYQYFKFDPTKVKLSKDSYRRYIQPQVKNISTEFYFLARNITPAISPIIEFRKNTAKLVHNIWNFQRCSDLEKCEQQHRIITQLISNEIHNLFKINENIFSKSELKSSSYDNYLKLVEQSQQARLILFKIQSQFQLINLLAHTNFDHNSPKLESLNFELTQLENTANQMLIELLPSEYKGIFDELLNHFIIPLEKRVMKEPTSKWLIENLGRLNLTWNTFHMSLSKGGLSFPKSQINLLKIMHNRWNSILKMIF